MTPIDFVTAIRESIIDSNLEIYKELFTKTRVEDANDIYWIDALKFFNKLGANEKQVLFKIIRQIEVDTISNFFAILDGVSMMEGQENDFKLSMVNKEDEIINGDLQDIFLEMEKDG